LLTRTFLSRQPNENQNPIVRQPRGPNGLTVVAAPENNGPEPMDTSEFRPTGGNVPDVRRFVPNGVAHAQPAGNTTASRPQSGTPMASLINFGQERTVIIKQDLHDGRLHDINMESVQMIKNKARRISIQKGAFGDVYFSMYSSHSTRQHFTKLLYNNCLRLTIRKVG